MELRSRSRSKTPFQTESFIEGEAFSGSNHLTVTRTTRRSLRTTTATSVGGNSSEYYESINSKGGKNRSSKATRSLYKTSDYSSEEGEVEGLTHISENERNQIIEDAIAAANGDAEVSALNLYRKAGRYWDKYPKTDYTYSRHSRDRVELAPGVVQMPNMSRRTIHADSSTNTESYFVSKSNQIRQRLFSSSSNNNDDELDGSYKIIRASSASSRRTILSRILSVFTSIYTVTWWCLYTAYQTSNSTTIYFGKKLHHLASRVMLLDTWLLKKSSPTDPSNKIKAVLGLCFLPLLLFAAWFLLSSLGSAIYWSLLNPSTTPVPPPIEEPQKTITEEQTFAFPPSVNINSDEIIEKILQSPPIYNLINNYHTEIKTGKESNEKLRQLIDELRKEMEKMKEEIVVLDKSRTVALDRAMSQMRTENVRNLAHLTQRINKCCNKHMIDLEPHISKVFSNLLNDPDYLSNQKGLTDWLSAMFVARQHLEDRLSNLTENLGANFKVSVDSVANQVMDRVVTRLVERPSNSDPISDEQIRKIVQSSLRIYDADKTGLVDYAMEPLGGEIVTTRCTESYHSGTAVISVLGIPVWYPTISPRTVISPGINPGECWAFQNFPGFLVLKLAGRVQVEAFSMEHVSRLLVPEGKIDSAPKEFEVYGLDKENDKDPVLIGEYVYDYDGDSLQFFTAQIVGSFSLIEIRIKSNHGNPNYTCLYRFRVHGKLAK